MGLVNWMVDAEVLLRTQLDIALLADLILKIFIFQLIYRLESSKTCAKVLIVSAVTNRQTTLSQLGKAEIIINIVGLYYLKTES